MVILLLDGIPLTVEGEGQVTAPLLAMSDPSSLLF